MNDSELLIYQDTDAKISHQLALEYEKYRETLKQIQHEESLKELEQDMKQLRPPRKSDAEKRR